MTKKEIHREIRERFYDIIEEKFPYYSIDSDGFGGRVQISHGNDVIEYHMTRHTICSYSDMSYQGKADVMKMLEIINDLVREYDI
tara:strand:+ start:245 stop:499 length:255 start_codon:yes stop_codon:yes gene_type:complete